MTGGATPRPRTRLLPGALSTAVAMAVRVVVNLAVAILVARLLGAVGKGQLTLVQQYAAFFTLALGLGFDAAHAYFVGRKGVPADEAVSISLLVVASTGIVGVPVLWLVLNYAVPTLAGAPAPMLAVATATVVPATFATLLAGVLLGQGRISAQSVVNIAAAVVTVAAVAVFALLGALTVTTVVTALLAASLVAAVGHFVATGVRRLRRPGPGVIRAEASYAWRSHLQNMAGYLELRQDVFILGFLTSAATVGVYSVAVSFAELIVFAPQAVVNALTARSLQEEAQAGAELTARVTRLIVALSLVFVVLLAVLIRPVIAIAFGSAFADAAWVFLLLVPGVFSWALASQPQAYLASHGRLFPMLGVVGLALNLGLNLSLIPLWGMYGAAVATSISYTAGNAYVVAVFCRRTATPLSDLVAVRRADLATIAAAARSLLSRSA